MARSAVLGLNLPQSITPCVGSTSTFPWLLASKNAAPNAAADSPSTFTLIPNQFGLRYSIFLVRISKSATSARRRLPRSQATPNRPPPVHEHSPPPVGISAQRHDRMRGRTDIVADVLFLSFNAACLVGRPAAPVAKL